MSEAVDSDPKSYSTFNDFFTRSIKPRTIDNIGAAITSPVDGCISQIGRIENRRIFQAKGRYFDLVELLGGDKTLAEPFEDGHFTTIYLSPKDYHRIHTFFEGRLTHMTHVPGDLFSVNPTTVAGVENLFARNERVVAHFESTLGPVAIVMVGATIVGSIETVWSGIVTPPSANSVHHWDYSDQKDPGLTFKQGDEIGRFRLGSTVILLLPPNRIKWDEHLQCDSPLRMGETIASLAE